MTPPGRAAGRAGALALAGALAAAAAGAQNSAQLVAVAARGNFQTGGVVATIAGDADGDASAALEWRRAGAGPFRAAQPLVRVDATRFVGSLFGLRPGGAWEARVTLADPDGVTGTNPRAAAFATRASRPVEPTLRALYVAPWGDDGNPGTDPAHPLATLQAAADRVQPGDLVSVAPGVYRESVTVTASGTAAQPIVFRGAGAGAILDGADAAIAAGAPWTNAGGGVWSRVTGFATGHVVTDSGRLFRYGSLAELQALAAGPPGGFWFDGTALRVKFTDGSAPAAHAMHVARLENGFLLDGVAEVRVENLEIRHYGAGDYGKGVYLRYAADSGVRGCRIHEVEAAGVWVKGGERNLVEGNEIWDTSIPGWDWNWTKGSSAENDAVALTDELGRGNVVRRNVLHGTFNGVGGCGSLPPPDGGFTTETDLSENVLYDHNDDAFEPEGWCANVRLWGNFVADSHMAFAVAPAAPGPTWIVRNVAWDFGRTRTSQQDGYTASALKINSGYPEPVGPLLLLHNTFLTTAPATDGLALLDPGYSTWLVARDSLIGATADVFYKVNPIVSDFDHDLVWTTQGGRFGHWEGTTFATFAGFRAGTGQEAHGLFAAPGLVDPAGGDFTPAAGSPAVNAALPLAGIDDSPIGDPPDLGAVERSALFADDFEEGEPYGWSGIQP